MSGAFAWAGEADLAAAEGEAAAPEAARAKLPLPLKLILLTLFLPEAFSFFVFGLRLTCTRLLFLVITPMVMTRFAGKIAYGPYRFVASDVFVPLTAFWMFLGPGVMYGLADTLVHSGPVVLEYLIAYMATRVLLTERGQAVAFAELLCFIICFVVADALLDTATGRYFTRELADHLTGYNKVWHVADEFRFGLLRAAGPIEHPILLGFICAIGLLISLAVKIRRKRLCIFMCGLGVAIAFSSGPEQCAIMGIGLLVYARLFRGVSGKWVLLSIPPLIGAAILFESTNSPFGRLFDYVTIDPQTAYFRLYIWNVIGPAVLDSPWFGVVEGSYDYEGSVDSVWLVLSMLYGVPCAILTGLSMIGACSRSTSWPRALLPEPDARLGTALGIVIFLVIFMGFTVHFWGCTWILIGLLVGVRAHLGELGHLEAAAAMAAAAEEATEEEEEHGAWPQPAGAWAAAWDDGAS